MKLRGCLFAFASNVDESEAAELSRLLLVRGANVSRSGAELHCVLVFASFEGEEFTTARSKRKKIVGTPCLAQVLVEKRAEIPLLDLSPVFCLLLEDHVICATGLAQSELDRVTRQVGLMGGKFFNDFVDSVTHLLATRPSASGKYQLAVHKKRIPVVRPQWVLDMWELQERRAWEGYRVLPFVELQFCGLGLDAEVTHEMRQLIEANGGIWSPSSVPDRKTTHVIVPLGDTSKRAVTAGTKIVPPTWVRECVRLGGRVDETLPELQSAFVAFVTSDCPPNAAALVAQCNGTTTCELEKATVVVSPVGLRPDSQLLRNRGLTVVSPKWLLESAAAGRLLPTEAFAPTVMAQPSSSGSSVVMAPRGGRAGAAAGVGLFSGFSFCVVGFNEDTTMELTSLIMAGGGKLGSGGQCLYIVADGHTPPSSCDRQLSSTWLRVAAATGLPPEMDHFCCEPQPHRVPLAAMALVHVSSTGFEEPERSLIEDCVMRLGGRFNSRLIKDETTHLICKVPSGPKYETVVQKKWDVQLVSLGWLRQCCAAGRPVDATDYPVIDASGSGRVLRGLGLFFSSSLSNVDQRRYGDLARSLGADVLLAWSDQATHLIHVGTASGGSGRKAPRDMPSESELERAHVVSPAWLLECQKLQQRADESAFPAWLNPRRNLGASLVVGQPAGGSVTPLPVPPLPPPASSSGGGGGGGGSRPASTRRKQPEAFQPLSSVVSPANQQQQQPQQVQQPQQKRLKAFDHQQQIKDEKEDREEEQEEKEEEGSAPNEKLVAGLESELNGLMGAIRSFGSGKSRPDNEEAGSSGKVLVRQPSNNSSGGGAGGGSSLRTSSRASGVAVLRRAELKGATPAAPSSLNGGDGDKDEEERQEKGVTYVDQKQLRKQRQALERSRIRGSGTGESLKKKRYIDSQEEEMEEGGGAGGSPKEQRSSSSLELESESQILMKALKQQQEKLHFTLSKYDEDEKRELSGVIARLGGVTDDEFLPGVTTRVVVPVPSRSLKYLLGAASGVWVLRGDYLRECGRRNRFVNEEPFEWAQHALPAGAVQSADKIELSEAPRKMRALRERGEPPLFHCMRCCFLGPSESTDTYRQLAAALGASIVYSGTKPNWSKLGADVTHVFCTSNYTFTPEDIQNCEGKGCHMAEWIVQAILRARLPKSTEFVPSTSKTNAKKR